MNLTLLDGYKWSHVLDDDEDDEDDEDDVDVFSTILHINLLGSTLHFACVRPRFREVPDRHSILSACVRPRFR